MKSLPDRHYTYLITASSALCDIYLSEQKYSEAEQIVTSAIEVIQRKSVAECQQTLTKAHLYWDLFTPDKIDMRKQSRCCAFHLKSTVNSAGRKIH